MADNTTLNAGIGGDIVRTEDIGGVKYPVSKIYLGAAGVNGGPVTAANPLPITDTSGKNTDAFTRLRVSSPFTLFDSKQSFFDGLSVYFTGSTGTGATSVYNRTRASTLLSVTNAAGSTAFRQSKRYINYQPGKSQLALLTFVASGAQAGNVKSVGLFDANDGYIFQLNGATARFVVRSSVSGVASDANAANQADWNLDTLNGNGPSGINLDFTKAQILAIDYEWLGVGSVRFGFVVAGTIHWAHQFRHSNVITSVYSQTPNLPVRWEIVGSGTAGSLEAICCSVMSEGGQERTGIHRTADRRITAKLGNANNLEQIIAIRKRSGYTTAQVLVTDMSFLSTGNTSDYWCVLLNPTVSGAASWTTVDSQSAVEYDINLTAAGSRIVTGGTMLESGYASNSGGKSALVDLGELAYLGETAVGVSDTIVLAAQSVSGNATWFGGLCWVEPT